MYKIRELTYKEKDEQNPKHTIDSEHVTWRLRMVLMRCVVHGEEKQPMTAVEIWNFINISTSGDQLDYVIDHILIKKLRLVKYKSG